MTTIPTIQQLYTSILADLESDFEVSIPVLGKSFLRALSGIQAAKLKLSYYALGKLQKNLWPDSADSVANGGTLERFGEVKLGRSPFSATQGQYLIEVTGTIGATIKAQTLFKSNDTAQNPGKLYILDTAYELATEIDTITVRALEAGLDSKLNAGELLTATQPIAGVDSQAEVAEEVVAPQAAEEIEDYRTKIVQAFRLEPQGGATGDYVLWAQDAQAVKRVYPYASSGNPNEIDLYVEATEADSTDGKGTPSAGLLEDVEEVIETSPDTTLSDEERGRRPLGVFQVNVEAITPLDIDITINDFLNITAEKQTLISNALEEAIAAIRPFVPGADIESERNDTLSVNVIISTILAAVPGAAFGAIELEVDGTPETSFTFTNGDIPYKNSITYA